ncbi:MAG: hypothetical protein NZT92_17565 [Abditibacteriales bacterium]|nr:hypothetical protein [Abditibacteriales bacterium]MDW8366015.1 hypothetical protein [Abditibacteriales bacterium]
MAHTITLTLPPDLEDSLLALRADGETLEEVTVRLLRKAVTQAATSHPEHDILSHPAVKEVLRRYKYDPNEMLGIGMTVGEYMSLSEEERERLWNEEFRKELDKDDEPELDVPPTALTPRQRRGATRPRRMVQPQRRRKAHR